MPLFDPLDQFNGWPPVAVAGRVGDIDNAQTDYLKKYFDEGGVPPGMLKTEQRMNKDKIKDLRKLWLDRYSGWRDWQAPIIMGQGYEYQQVGSAIPDMGIDLIDARSESRICSILKVPPIIVGAKVGLDRATFANYKEARESWWQDTVRPMYLDILSALNQQIVNRFDPSLELVIDFSEVPAFQEDEDSKYNRAQTGVSGGWMSVNEAREYVGLDPLPGTAGDVFLRGFSMIEVPMNELRTTVIGNPVTPLLTDGEDDTEDEDPESENEPAAGDLDEDPEAEGAKELKESEGEFIDEYDEDRRKMEKRFEKQMNAYLKGLQERVIAEVVRSVDVPK
jgi:hypothetical protein